MKTAIWAGDVTLTHASCNCPPLRILGGGECRFAFQGGTRPLNDFNYIAETALP